MELRAKRLSSGYLGCRTDGRKAWLDRRRLNPSHLCIIYITHQEEVEMDFVRNMQSKDWIVAAVAFVAGAFFF